jgi:DNA phosphorothioation-associated putative methyltransferase
MLELGRVPSKDELDPDFSASIREEVGSIRRAESLCRRLFDVAALGAAADARHSDLLVYFALNLFNRRQPYRFMPEGLQRDVKVFFGSVSSAEEAGRQLLFSVGNRSVIEECCQEAAACGLGHLRQGDSLQLHAALVERLRPELRCYVGCAGKLYGDIENADLVKIHIRSGKLTLLRYDAFDSSPVPALQERIKIDMKLQRIESFDHASRSSQLLLMKSWYLAQDQPGYSEQLAFDEKLAALNLFDLEAFGPTAEEFGCTLESAGVRQSGFDLRAIRKPGSLRRSRK